MASFGFGFEGDEVKGVGGGCVCVGGNSVFLRARCCSDAGCGG